MMGLWIRDQWKMDLACVNYVCIDNEDQLFILAKSGETYVTLGRYETKERALAVLDEIQTKISLGHTIYEMPKE